MDNTTIGHSIRTLRQELGWTLEEFSSRCELSKGFLSQVERGLSSLSLTSLKLISDALDVPLTRFFALSETDRPAVTKSGKAPFKLQIADSDATYLLFSGNRENRALEAFIGEYPPHYAPETVSHEGEEFAYILEGKFEVVFEEEIHTLEPGDTFQIRSDQLHTIRNLTDQPGRILWVQTMKLMQ